TGLKATAACALDVEGNGPTASMMDREAIPSASCNAHHALTICGESHLIATEYCPEKVQVAVLRVTPEVSANRANSYLNTLKSMYPNFNSGATCSIHTTPPSSSTVAPTESSSSAVSDDLTAIRQEAQSLLVSAYNIIKNNPSTYTEAEMASLKNAYNNLNSYYKQSNATKAGIQQRMNTLKSKIK
ncbi:MAG: hypothetical protein IJR47_04265, partial [Clostridia bacterium]|nr:hypothetical protein [Clostridia bacterium]